MEKWYLQASWFMFDQIFVERAGNQDRHQIKMISNSGQIGSVTSELSALEGGLNFQSTYYGISKIRCPVLIKFYMYYQWDGGKAVFRLWSRFHRNCGCHGNRKAPIDIIIMGKRCLHVDSFSFDQIYGIKSQASSNFSQIGPHPWASKKNPI